MAAEWRRTAMLDAKKRDELEAERRRAAMESENRAAELAAERRRAAILNEEKRIEALKRSLEEQEQEQARQAMQQGVQQQPLLHSRADALPKTEPEQPEPEMEAEEAEETEEARRTVVLTNNDALATHLSPNWCGPGLASAQSQYRPHMVPTWFKLCPGSRMVHTLFPIGS